MAAETTVAVAETDTECPACLDLCEDARRLSCSHTVCQKCCQKLINRHALSNPSAFTVEGPFKPAAAGLAAAPPAVRRAPPPPPCRCPATV